MYMSDLLFTMSELVKLTEVILKEHFGDTIHNVGKCLLKQGPSSFRYVIQETGLNVDQVKKSLCRLVHHNLVQFGKSRKGYIEYVLSSDSVASRIYFSWFIYTTKLLYGDVAELIVETLLLNGQMSFSKLTQHILEYVSSTGHELQGVSPTVIRDQIKSLVATMFIVPCEQTSEIEVKCSVPLPSTCAFTFNRSSGGRKRKKVTDSSDAPPAKISRPSVSLESDLASSTIPCRVNINRYCDYLRDQAIIAAVCRKVDKKAGEIVRAMLRLSEVNTAAGSALSASVSLNEISQAMPRDQAMSKSSLESYLKVLTEDSTEFVLKTGDSGGGMFSINYKRALHNLCVSHIESYIQERFGSTSLRIWRVLMLKKQMEQTQIEECAMIPAKEAKELLYQLFWNNLVKITEIPKTQDHAPSRTFYLFSVDLDQVARLLLEKSYQAMKNLIIRRNHETAENRRLIEKQQKVDAVLASLPDDDPSLDLQRTQIEESMSTAEKSQLAKVKEITNKLGQGEVQLSQAILILQQYLKYVLI